VYDNVSERPLIESVTGGSLSSSNKEQSVKWGHLTVSEVILMTMTLDTQLTILSNHHRRRVLLALVDNAPQTTPIGSTATVETDGGDQLQTIAMQHNHLPKLADHGFIDWDRETQRVAKGAQFEEIEPLLTVLSENQDMLPAGGAPD
jgi:hypothetical protein